MTKIRLSIELVPQTCWFSNVRAVVSKNRWKTIASQVYSKAYHLCEICGGTGPKHPVECHEIWDYDDKKLIQKLVGMIALCPDCHMVKHIGLARIQNKGERAIQHLMKVNNLNRSKAERYVIDAFQVWGQRSSKQWKLDISHLKDYKIDIKQIRERK